MSAALQNRPIAEIRIGHRHRRDLGDVDQLAASIADLGLLQPVVVRPDGQLIAGERRLRAAQLLGWKEIPVSIVDLTEIARGEYAENTLRKNFTLSEAVAIKRALEPLERAAAKERMLAGKPSGKFPRVVPSTRSPRLSARTAPRSPRRRPSSMRRRPSRKSLRNCSPAWTAAVG